MSIVDETVSAIRALISSLSPSDQKAVLRIISPRGRAAVTREEVHEQGWTYLMQLATCDGEFLPEWMVNLTLEDLGVVKQRPTPEELYELEVRLKQREKRKKNDELLSTDEDLVRVAAGPPRETLSLLAWLWTTQGWAVYERGGLEVFFQWATDQTNKLIDFKTMTTDGFMNAVRQRLGRKKDQDHPPKGTLLTYGRDVKDEFLMAACFGWRNKMRQTLLLKERGRSPGEYYRRQQTYINDLAPHPTREPRYRVTWHPTYVFFTPISK
jgi:hypothetical protein